ncbi:MAG TPA: helix-turn-helix transcriptional regulator, partial [Candidatus Eisenbacteria bacterium]|nr:helix-turn-helix transcriptional regulator [Candidatus Eisenbacteria bacterium]
MAYATLGAGPALLCDLGRLHHLDVFWRYPPYRRLVEGLAQRFTVVRLDRPGCGLSERDEADFTIDGE